MTKYAVMVLLGIIVAALPILGFTQRITDILIVISGLGIAVLAYLSSVVYCSNCKKLIEEAEKAFDDVSQATPPNPPHIQ